MGEALPFMLDRIDETSAVQAKTLLRRSVRQTILDQVWITTSGFFSMVPFMAALMSFGVDRIMFSVATGSRRTRAPGRSWPCCAGRSREDRPWQRRSFAASAGLTAIYRARSSPDPD
jgi:hypothetical protein